MTEESIYNLIPPASQKKKKSERYRSKYDPTIPPTASGFGLGTKTAAGVANVGGQFSLESKHIKPGATMGGHSSKPAPLKKTQRTLPKPQKFNYGDTAKRPSVPRAAECKKGKKKQPKKNFIMENALKAVMAAPKKEEGDLRYTQKEDYGKVPQYLEHVRREIDDEEEYMRTLVAKERQQEESNQPKVRLLAEEDRLELLASLKAKWAESNHQYQLMSHQTTLDTVGKIKRKEYYENELGQLEKAIEKMSKPNVFVSDE